MSAYTPTTEQVRDQYGGGNLGDGSYMPQEEALALNLEEFDRWLAGVKAQAWAEGITASGINLDWQLHLLDHNPYTEEA